MCVNIYIRKINQKKKIVCFICPICSCCCRFFLFYSHCVINVIPVCFFRVCYDVQKSCVLHSAQGHPQMVAGKDNEIFSPQNEMYVWWIWRRSRASERTNKWPNENKSICAKIIPAPQYGSVKLSLNHRRVSSIFVIVYLFYSFTEKQKNKTNLIVFIRENSEVAKEIAELSSVYHINGYCEWNWCI